MGDEGLDEVREFLLVKFRRRQRFESGSSSDELPLSVPFKVPQELSDRLPSVFPDEVFDKPLISLKAWLLTSKYSGSGVIVLKLVTELVESLCKRMSAILSHALSGWSGVGDVSGEDSCCSGVLGLSMGSTTYSM